ncbi:MAG: hypothetical protein E7287_04825 [Lachnospiraceae bacterium]|nr:hypothetical protein [Lachnospiraceae bacterium]
MKKEVFKKGLAAMLAVVMMLSATACGRPNDGETTKQSPEATTSGSGESTSAEVEDTGITFPLKEEVTFKLAYRSSADTDPDVLEKCVFWQELYETTNVKIELVKLPATDTMTKLNALFMSNQEPDGIFSSFMKDADIDQLVASELLMPITDYVKDPEVMPNFHERVLSESPKSLGYMTSPDGEIYTLVKYSGLEADFLESPMFINKVWVEKAGWKVEDIKTIDDLEAVLTYFAENDMNGNGKDDEIPYMVKADHSANHFEAFLGLYGIPTKNGAKENYVYVEDGKVIFAPTTTGFKDAIIKLNDWYEKGLIWEEAFTATADTFNAKYTGEEAVIGLYQYYSLSAVTSDQYVTLLPVKVEGYEPSWYVNPGSMGAKNHFIVTKDCENADILLAWLDQFYKFENAWRWAYGEEEDGRYTVENGVYKVNEELKKDKVAWDKLNQEKPAGSFLITQMTTAYTAADYASGKLELTKEYQRLQENYELYRPYLNDEIWPRPYMTADATNKLSELRTDIFSTVDMKKAEWITGKADIEKDWDAYCESLNKMGVDELVSLMQEAYDTYMAGQK